MRWAPRNHHPVSTVLMHARRAMEPAFVRAAAATAAISSAARMSRSAVSTALDRGNALRATALAIRNTIGEMAHEDATMDAADPPPGEPEGVICLACYRSGFCARCKGNGRVQLVGVPASSIPCPDCGGTGVCPECDGTGRITETPVKFDPHMCFTCRGTGFCERCNGNGRYFYRGGHALVDCLLCAGSGSCSECDGTGRVLPQTEDD
jgi:hypothetical protein